MTFFPCHSFLRTCLTFSVLLQLDRRQQKGGPNRWIYEAAHADGSEGGDVTTNGGFGLWGSMILSGHIVQLDILPTDDVLYHEA